HRHGLLVARLEFLTGDGFEIELLRAQRSRKRQQRGGNENWKRFHRAPLSRWMPEPRLRRGPPQFRRIPVSQFQEVVVSQSGSTVPVTPSKAPGASSATSSRPGSTGPGIVTCRF